MIEQPFYMLAVLLMYLIGSASSSILIARLMGLPDPRDLGSGNPGATNMLRTGSKIAAALTLVGDLLKSLVPLLIARFYGFELYALCLMGLAAIIGHMFPIYYQFRGGKGVATTLGVLLAISWPLALSWGVIWLCLAVISRYSSLAAIVATISLPLASYFLNPHRYVLFTTVAIVILVLWRHQSNIRNLLSGKESKIGTKH